MIKSFMPSLLRTVVPLVVAVIAGWPITQELGIEAGQLEVAVSVVVGALYWLIVRALETYVPQVGWLLGYAAAPAYLTPAAASAGAVVRQVIPRVD